MNFEFAANCKMVLINVVLIEVENVVLVVAVKLKKMNHPSQHYNYIIRNQTSDASV